MTADLSTADRLLAYQRLRGIGFDPQRAAELADEGHDAILPAELADLMDGAK